MNSAFAQGTRQTCFFDHHDSGIFPFVVCSTWWSSIRIFYSGQSLMVIHLCDVKDNVVVQGRHIDVDLLNVEKHSACPLNDTEVMWEAVI